MTKEKKLYRLLFLASVALLLINDFYLKYEFHNYLTGKLSDFAGLFAFPYFFSCFFTKRSRQIYVFTAVFFIYWKSSFSQPIFDFIHAYGLDFDRIVDYSDLFALLILPISYWYWKTDFKIILNPKRIFKPIIIGVCCFAFMATSHLGKTVRYDYKSDFETVIKVNKEMNLDSIESRLYLYGDESENRHYYEIRLPEKRISITTKIEILELKDGILKLKLDSIFKYNIQPKSFNLLYSKYDRKDKKYIRNLTVSEIEKLFENEVKKQMILK